MDDYTQANRRLWDEWTHIHEKSELYRLEQFKAGENKLNPLEITEVGPVAGKSLLHLQCHFGMDTLSWARLGAQVTGIDLSPEAIRLAGSLSAELDIPGRFICCNLYDLLDHLHETFDIVYTSYGVLAWLPDLTHWASLIAFYLKPGGVFYIAEIHPFAMIFDDEASELKVRYPYFNPRVQAWDVHGSYADPTAEVQQKVSYEWDHPLGAVLTALIQAGLSLEFVHEFPFACYQQFPFLQLAEDGYWYLPGKAQTVPLIFSVRARKLPLSAGSLL
jgi:SAM-dependent methyltransferase